MKYNLQKYRNTIKININNRNSEIQITKNRNYKSAEIQITGIHKYKQQKCRNTNYKNTDMQVKKSYLKVKKIP